MEALVPTLEALAASEPTNPVMASKVASASAGTVLESGAVRLAPHERTLDVTLVRPIV